MSATPDPSELRVFLRVCDFLNFSTPVMLSGSAAQAAVESKHPRFAYDPTTVDTFSAAVSQKKAREATGACHRMWGPSTAFGFASLRSE